MYFCKPQTPSSLQDAITEVWLQVCPPSLARCFAEPWHHAQPALQGIGQGAGLVAMPCRPPDALSMCSVQDFAWTSEQLEERLAERNALIESQEHHEAPMFCFGTTIQM